MIHSETVSAALPLTRAPRLDWCPMTRKFMRGDVMLSSRNEVYPNLSVIWNGGSDMRAEPIVYRNRHSGAAIFFFVLQLLSAFE